MPGLITISAAYTCQTDGQALVTFTFTVAEPEPIKIYLEDSAGKVFVLTAERSPAQMTNRPNGAYTYWAEGEINGPVTPKPLTIDCEPSDPDNPPPPTPPISETPGTIMAPAAKYLAVGGILTNPIEYIFNAGLFDALGNAKTDHYVLVNIYREGQTVPFAITRQRVRNGQAKVDVSQYLMELVNSEPQFLNNTLIATDRNAIAGFYIGVIEQFGDTPQAEVMAPDIKYAVNAANQVLDSDFSEYVVTEAGAVKKLITFFADPVKFIGYPFSLGTIIDESLAGTQLYFERRYLDINHQLLETKSTAIPQQYYGKFLRLNLLDYMLNCGAYVEATITDTNLNTDGVCPDGSVTPEPDPDDPTTDPNIITPEPPTVIADDKLNTLTATHPLGASEMLMRTDGGAWGAYAAVDVGNINRPANYWEYKIKAATNRNESALVGSPAFTEVVLEYTLTVVVNGLDGAPFDIFINGIQQSGSIFTYPAGTVLDSVTVAALGFEITPKEYSVMMNADETLTFNAVAKPETSWGWTATDPFGALSGGNDAIVYQGSAIVDDEQDIEADFHMMPSQQFAVLKVPATHKTLLAWMDTGSSLNYGQIPDSVFRASFTAGDFTYYVSRVPVDFSTAADARVLFNDNIIQ